MAVSRVRMQRVCSCVLSDLAACYHVSLMYCTADELIKAASSLCVHSLSHTHTARRSALYLAPRIPHLLFPFLPCPARAHVALFSLSLSFLMASLIFFFSFPGTAIYHGHGIGPADQHASAGLRKCMPARCLSILDQKCMLEYSVVRKVEADSLQRYALDVVRSERHAEFDTLANI